MLLSIVSPVYKAEKIVKELVSQIKTSVEPITHDFEIILVEDGSQDDSWKEISEQCKSDKRVKGIKLSKNFGQHNAITAGLEMATGDWIVVMDCDLQDKPSEIPALYKKAMEGFDVVMAKRIARKDSFPKKISSKIFYGIFSYLTDLKFDGTVANFGIYSSKAISAFKKMKEPYRSFSTMIRWVGFSQSTIEVEHGSRHSGTTSYSWNRLIKLAFDLILAYSDKPLRITVKVGFIISALSFLFGIYNITAWYFGIIKVTGYTSLIVSIWFLSGLIIFFLGLIGLYLSKIFDSVKMRPLFLVDNTINFEK